MTCQSCSRSFDKLWKVDPSKSVFDTFLLCQECKEQEGVTVPHLKGRKVRTYLPIGYTLREIDGEMRGVSVYESR